MREATEAKNENIRYSADVENGTQYHPLPPLPQRKMMVERSENYKPGKRAKIGTGLNDVSGEKKIVRVQETPSRAC